MKELQEVRNEVLHLKNMGVINKEEEIKLLNKLNALEKAINYTRCSIQLKDKYGKDFEYFVTNKVNVRNVGNIYWFKGIGYTDLDELHKKWLKITKPLIV